MRFILPASFPEDAFLNFGIVASKFFPRILSNDYLDDPLFRMQQFDGAWRAVRYRYRACFDCDVALKNMLASEADWRPDDEEQIYTLVRSVYEFFTNALAVFESLGFCLYFVGNALRPLDFPNASNPKAITLATTRKSFKTAFPRASITGEIESLLKNNEFRKVQDIRNILAHRLAGGRSSISRSILHADGTFTETGEETFHILGAKVKLLFDEGLFQRELDGVSALLTKLVLASVEFVQNNQPSEEVVYLPSLSH
jgi:hypothetical protein